MEETLDNSIEHVRTIRDYYLEQLPIGLTESEKEGFENRIRVQLGKAQYYVMQIYDEGFALGENLSSLIVHSTDRVYKLLINGLGRHLMDGPAEVEQAGFLVQTEGEER